MNRIKLLLCHTDGFIDIEGTQFCRKGIYYPVTDETEVRYTVTTEYGRGHHFTKANYKRWFQLVEVERAYYEIMS